MLKLKIEKVAHGGVFIARHDNKVVFVSGALPGEVVNAKVVQDTKSFLRAETLEVIEPSEHRVKHFWKAALRGAGGAEFGHITLDYQRVLKTEVLREALSRMAGLESDVEVEAAPGDDKANGLRYRTRVQLNVDESGTAGPSKVRTNEIVFTRDLPLAVLEIEELGLHLKNFNGVEKIKIAASNTGNLQWSIDKKLNGDAQLIERVAGRTFRLSPGSFWQSHKAAPELLTGCVKEFADLLGFESEKQNLDLYSGVGLFSATLSNSYPGSKFLAVESAKQAIEDGERSTQDLPNLKFHRADVLKFLRSQSAGSFDTIVLDPPRSGAANKVVEQLIRLQPRNLIYVACDPVALARDLRTLGEAGYSLKAIKAFDIFPHTHHFETVVALSR
ncbi:MAG: class I SAM-dependent RNA methyltransferase [Micrococcales bacterium]|jgi:tRNA/tmRNA/rRNA uracil-C5-methylase (TrmA/RlmC/RlmD family)|nr:class I SAM-dependent RNA methyltransferase [Micrococcales bacterium]